MEVEEYISYFGISQEELAHHGVKGMHWGIHKNRDGDSESSGGYESAISKEPRSREAAVAHLKQTQQDSLRKTDASEEESSKRRLSPIQKRNLEIAAGLAAAGAIVALGVYKTKNDPEFLDRLASLAGKKIDPKEFNKAVDFSKAYSWGEYSYIQPSSFHREEFSIPAGHTYHRLSSAAEHSFSHATYATSSTDDFHRYVSHFSGAGRAPHHVTWSSKSEVKVPRLSKVLETMHETLTEEYKNASSKARKELDLGSAGGHYLSKENVLRTYEGHSGGQWSAPQAKSFIAKLKTKGYDAIIDETDAGVSNDRPLVIFSADKMGHKSATLVDEALRKIAADNLKELKDRKLGSVVTHSATTGDILENHVRHQARADANEFAKSRAYYGEGTGSRRKLIKAKIETRSSNPRYKKEFYRTLSGQNLEKRSAQATIAAGSDYAHNTGLDKVKKTTSRSMQEDVHQFLKSQALV